MFGSSRTRREEAEARQAEEKKADRQTALKVGVIGAVALLVAAILTAVFTPLFGNLLGAGSANSSGPTSTPSGSAQLSLTPRVGIPGQAVKATLTGLKPNTHFTIAFDYNSAYRQRQAVEVRDKAGSTGKVTVSLNIPGDATNERIEIIATDAGSGARLDSDYFTVDLK